MAFFCPSELFYSPVAGIGVHSALDRNYGVGRRTLADLRIFVLFDSPDRNKGNNPYHSIVFGSPPFCSCLHIEVDTLVSIYRPTGTIHLGALH